MDTISRENNTSILPIATLFVGGFALVIGIVALVKALPVKKLTDEVNTMSQKVDGMQSTVNDAATKADGAARSVNTLAGQTQRGFDQVTTELGNLRTEMNKLTIAKAGPAKAPKGAGEAAGSGDTGPRGDYTIKAGDTLAKIAKAHSLGLDSLEAANPGVDARRLKIGQKINLPKK
jgi:LysM repeat protein